MLAGLSLGNWIGGRWADRGGDDASTGVALALGCDLLFRTGTPLVELPEFSDDYVPVERTIAGLLLRQEGRQRRRDPIPRQLSRI